MKIKSHLIKLYQIKKINFLYCIALQFAPENKEEEYWTEDDCTFFKKLKKGEPLEELFKKNTGDDGEYFLLVKKKINEVYEIEFGIRYYLDGAFIAGTEHFGGHSRTWQVTFDENDSATCGEGNVCFFD